MKERNGWKPLTNETQPFLYPALNLTVTLKYECEKGTNFCALKKVIKDIKRKVNVFVHIFIT